MAEIQKNTTSKVGFTYAKDAIRKKGLAGTGNLELVNNKKGFFYENLQIPN